MRGRRYEASGSVVLAFLLHGRATVTTLTPSSVITVNTESRTAESFLDVNALELSHSNLPLLFSLYGVL